MRMIDADALLKRMQNDPLFDLVERYGVSGVIEAEPTVDAVPVIRCKDCKHYVDECCDRYADETLGYVHSTQESGYCWVAERKEE